MSVISKNAAKDKLRAGKCIYGTSVEYCLDPEVSLLLRRAGLDLFFIDTEHQAASYRDIRGICRTARDFGITPLVRVTQNEPALITRALDCGAMGIVVPRVHSPAEACAAVSAMKYLPEGNRGFGMHSIMTDLEWEDPATMMASANRETMTVLQVESKQALACIDAIAATPGLDVLFVGPYDLTISMGIAEQFQSQAFADAMDRVAAACEKNGVAAGIQTGDMNLLKEARRRGYRFLLYGSDFAVLQSAYRERIAEARAD
ncbi:MAG: aldolase/citrate lyase family protein [Bryobacteraceae bacterium]